MDGGIWRCFALGLAGRLGSRRPLDGRRIIWETGIERIWGSVCGLYRVSQLLLQASRRKMLIDPIMTFIAKLAPNVFY
jgi:hypothetical protein